MDRNRRLFSPTRITRRQAFTLIEMVLVVSLVSLVGLAAYQSLSSGLRIWDYSRKYVIEEDIAMFLERLTVHLKNVKRFSLFEFEGRKNSLSFPTIVRTRQDRRLSGGEVRYVSRLGKVRYAWDRSRRAVVLSEANYSQAAEETFGPERVLVSPVRSLSFRYFYENTDGETKHGNVLEGFIPSAVEVRLTFFDGSGQPRQAVRMIPLSQGETVNELEKSLKGP